jgi:hypothetical protein
MTMASPQVDFTLLGELENDPRIRAARALQLGPDAGQPAAAAERGPWNAFVPMQMPSAGLPPAPEPQQEPARPVPEAPASPVQRQSPAAAQLESAAAVREEPPKLVPQQMAKLEQPLSASVRGRYLFRCLSQLRRRQSLFRLSTANRQTYSLNIR